MKFLQRLKKFKSRQESAGVKWGFITKRAYKLQVQ